MRNVTRMLAVVALLAAVAGTAGATGFYAETDALGYKGIIWNMTHGTTGPWITSDGRNAAVYFHKDAGGDYPDYNQLLSSWFEHSPSNQNDSFLQLSEAGKASVTSAVGGWDATQKVFTVTVTGKNAPYPWSRMWQPDNGVAWGVTFTNYGYTFTATFPTQATVVDGWLVNSSDASSIVGQFAGQFVVTDDVNKNPITNGDTYGFDIAFDKALFSTDGGSYGTITPYYAFGSEVPEPLTMLSVFGAVAGIGAYLRRRTAA
jgi:hypothetical protein